MGNFLISWWLKCKLGNSCPARFEFMLRFLLGLYAGVMTDQYWYLIAQVVWGGHFLWYPIAPGVWGGHSGQNWYPIAALTFVPSSQIRRNFNWWFKCKLGNFCPACSKFAYRFYSRLYEGVMIDQCGYLLLRVYEGVTEVVPYRICGTRASFWYELVPYRNFDFWYNQNQFFYLYFYILGR